MPPPAKHGNWIKSSYPFVYGQFDPALFPTAEWRECNRMALAVLEIRNWAADMVDRDDPLLIEQIQARLLPRRGIFANPDEIIVTLGAQNALYMLANLLMTKGSKVAMEDPGYPDARSIFRLAGADTVPTPVDDQGIVTSAIPNDAGFVFVTPSHHCPTMVPLSAERRQDLLARASRNNQIIIEDGYDSQLLDEAPQQALKSIDRSGRVVYVGSMSKTLAPGLRLGYIVASAGLIAELRALRRFMLRHPPANNQRAVALFLSLGHHEALVRRLSSAFDERRKRLVQAISAFLPEWRSTDLAGGTSLWLEGPRGIDARDLAEAAAARSVIIEPGDRFFDRTDKPTRFMRLGISSIALQHIEPGIRELATAAGSRRGASRLNQTFLPQGKGRHMAAFLAYPPKSAGPRYRWPPLHSRPGSGIMRRSSGPTGRAKTDITDGEHRHANRTGKAGRTGKTGSTVERGSRRSGGREARRAMRAAPLADDIRPIRPGLEGGSYKALAEADLGRIHEAVLTLLETVGFANAIPSCIEALTRVGATHGADGRIRFPRGWSRTRSSAPRAISRCTARIRSTTC